MEVVAVVGAGEGAGAEHERAAFEVGRLLGERGIAVVTGGLGGVMAAASRGASEAGATVVGLLPGSERSAANPWVGIAIPTGMGELRNGLVVRAADGLVAVGGGHGTLSEVALALKGGRPVVGLGFPYDVDGVEPAASAAEAVALLLR